MQPVEITKDVHWVGAVDWDCRNFHGYSISPRGTTYNAYLIRDEKVTLFDTVKAEYAGKLLCNIAHLVKPGDIDYIVVNHVEMDHSGALPEIVAKTHPEKIFCSPMGERALKLHFDVTGWPIQVVKTGDTVSIGTRTLSFLETRMLHWPDSMATYVEKDKILIANDAFGQNIATSERFADEVDRAELYRQMVRYYANIVLPFSPITVKVIEQIESMKLSIDYLLPDHGVMYRGADVAFAIESYKAFAAQKPTKKAVVVYDTMWHSTEKMANAIADGLMAEGLSVRIMNLHVFDHSDVMEEVWDAGAVVVGSPTHNNGMMPRVADMLTYMKGLKPQNKIGGAFGSYGWSGEAVKNVAEALAGMGMEMPVEPLRSLYVPRHEELAKYVDMGRAIGKAVAAKVG